MKPAGLAFLALTSYATAAAIPNIAAVPIPTPGFTAITIASFTSTPTPSSITPQLMNLTNLHIHDLSDHNHINSSQALTALSSNITDGPHTEHFGKKPHRSNEKNFKCGQCDGRPTNGEYLWISCDDHMYIERCRRGIPVGYDWSKNPQPDMPPQHEPRQWDKCAFLDPEWNGSKNGGGCDCGEV